jgi:uncharacterized iron-regulated membrane protein
MVSTVLPAQVRVHRRSLLWRIHFWAALVASPFAIVACLTGVLYALTPQIERALYDGLDRVVPASQRLPLDEAVSAARKAAPAGYVLQSVVPASTPEETVRVAFLPPPSTAPARPAASATGHEGHGTAGAGASAAPSPAAPKFLRPSFGIPTRALVVYVDPYTARVTGTLLESDRFVNWSRKLHSSLLQGDGWRWMIELAASWLMVMLITGIFLWWPERGQPVLPSRGSTGRPAWRQWHALVGIALSLVSFTMLSTGLTWSRFAGNQVRWARDAAGQTPPRIPASFHSSAADGAKVISWEQAWQAIQAEAPRVATQIMPPMGREGVWRANHLEKRGEPTKSFDLLLDAYSGRPLYFSGWDQQTAFGKATAIGIPFHRGEFGIWNQVVLVLFGAGVLFSLVSGWVMFFKRWRRGRPVMPPVMPEAWRSVRLWAWPAAAAMFFAMPLLAASAVPIALYEAYAAWRGPRRAGGLSGHGASI